MNDTVAAIQNYVNQRTSTPIEISESDIVQGEGRRDHLWFLNRGFDSVTSSHERKFYDVETQEDALNALLDDIAAAGITNPDFDVTFGRVCADNAGTVDLFASFGYRIRNGIATPMVFAGETA